MLDFFKEWMSYSRKERRGIMVLFVLLVISIALSFAIRQFITYPEIDPSAFESEINRFYLETGQSDTMEIPDPDELVQQEFYAAKNESLFYFNPNAITEKQWRLLGVDDEVIQTIMNYKRKGGVFKQKEDLLKIYGFSKWDYLRLAPYITLEDDNSRFFRRYYSDKKYEGFRPRKSTADNRPEKPRPPDSLFMFNPNILDEAGFQKLGLPDFVIQNIMRYRSKGGRFYKKEDFKKIYGLSESDYKKLEPFIEVEEKKEFHPRLPEYGTIDINTADSSTLLRLPGIGEVLASRIIKYRQMLGGFYSPSQLLEVYGIDSSKYQLFKDYIIAQGELRKINLNSADQKTLSQHPYINYNLARAIINYRMQHGKFDSVGVIRNIYLVDEDLYRKIAPYLTVLP